MADEADMRNELADLQTRADQIADEVKLKTKTNTHTLKKDGFYLIPPGGHIFISQITDRFDVHLYQTLKNLPKENSNQFQTFFLKD